MSRRVAGHEELAMERQVWKVEVGESFGETEVLWEWVVKDKG